MQLQDNQRLHWLFLCAAQRVINACIGIAMHAIPGRQIHEEQKAPGPSMAAATATAIHGQLASWLLPPYWLLLLALLAMPEVD